MTDKEIDILYSIDANNKPLTTIYVGIGVAAHMRTFEKVGNKDICKLNQEYDQQRPVCLGTLKTHLPFEPMHCFFIDPCLENPPHIVTDSSGKRLGEEWEVDKYDNNIYHNDTSNIHVYACRFCATHVSDYNRDELMKNNHRADLLHYVDITKFLDTLNELAIKNKWFVLYHDFTGRDINPIANHYDDFLGDHRNHIVYGIGMRQDGGCYIDLRKPECDFYYTWSNDSIEVLNPFMYEGKLKELIQLTKYIADEIDAYTLKVIEEQIKVLIKSKLQFILETIIEVFRKVSILRTRKDITPITEKQYSYFVKKYNINFPELIATDSYDELYRQLCIAVEKELKIFFDYFISDNNFATNLMIELMSQPDEYKWHTIATKYIERCISDHF